MLPGLPFWVGVVVIVGVIAIAVKTRELWGRVGLGLIVLGGVSNLWSRFWYGGVVDNWVLGGMLYNNLADYLIVFGAFIYGYTYFVRRQRDRRN